MSQPVERPALTRFTFLRLAVLGLGALCLAAFVGCTGTPTGNGKDGDGKVSADQEKEAEIKASLAKLGPEDQKRAEEQRFCAIEDENRLGSMGMPVKVVVKDQPVFLCCKSCQKKALADPDKTLAKAQELKARTKESSGP